MSERPRSLTLQFLAEPTDNPMPFVWTADPDRIIAKVTRGYQALAPAH